MFKLELLEEKPWYIHLAAFGCVALILYLGFWYFVTSGTRAKTAEIESQVAKLQRDNAGAQIAGQRLSEFKANYARAQADYDDLKALLPEQRELTMVLHNIQERARGRLTLRRFTPKDDTQQDFYSGKPVEVEVAGTYNNVGQFFAQMAGYQRIVSITDFKVMRNGDEKSPDRADGKTVGAQFLLTAYYVSPEKLQPETEAGKPAGKKAGAKKTPAKAKAKAAE